MDTFTDLVNEMNRLVASADNIDLHLRVFGGLAIYVHSRNDTRFFHRESPDLDFIVPKNERHKLESYFREMGYSPNKQFNILNGAHRQIFYHDQVEERRIDILIGDFEMCHKLPLEGRFDVDDITIPLTDLFLSKAQVVQLNRKDALDIISLLLNNDVGDEQDGGIDLQRITDLCGNDWGLYKTLSINLERVTDLLIEKDIDISDEERDSIRITIQKMQKAVEEMPKSTAWKMRDKIGIRVRWYQEVEEVDQ
ncbi:MAG TPA: hypothetical protein VLA72_10845 [Anaerolineales bacterium]|nr:hypothetical protein [Anaerolineales bacterium]